MVLPASPGTYPLPVTFILLLGTSCVFFVGGGGEEGADGVDDSADDEDEEGKRVASAELNGTPAFQELQKLDLSH